MAQAASEYRVLPVSGGFRVQARYDDPMFMGEWLELNAHGLPIWNAAGAKIKPLPNRKAVDAVMSANRGFGAR